MTCSQNTASGCGPAAQPGVLRFAKTLAREKSPAFKQKGPLGGKRLQILRGGPKADGTPVETG